MFLGDVNVFLVLFFFLLSTLITNPNTSLHLLFTAELLWITLYGLVLITGLAFDDLNVLSLSFFFLIFSAVEFGVGLVIMLLQHLLTRTLNLDAGGSDTAKYSTNSTRQLMVGNLSYKI